MKLSIISPAFNEARNLEVVVPEIDSAMKGLNGWQVQLVVVDDGSTDDTEAVLSAVKTQHLSVHPIIFPMNRGKSEALKAGFEYSISSGADFIAMIDADGQDVPEGLLHLIEKAKSGFDVVSGARKNRQDRFVKRVTSRLYNRVTSSVFGVRGTDFNSGLKIFTRKAAIEILPYLYGDMHRYLNVIAPWRGLRVAEIAVQHRPRLYGNTKYGLSRFWRGFFDLLSVRFLIGYQSRPFHIFGTAGFILLMLGALVLLYLSLLWFSGIPIGDRPLLLGGVLLVTTGLQMVLTGFVADLIVFGGSIARTSRLD